MYECIFTFLPVSLGQSHLADACDHRFGNLRVVVRHVVSARKELNNRKKETVRKTTWYWIHQKLAKWICDSAKPSKKIEKKIEPHIHLIRNNNNPNDDSYLGAMVTTASNCTSQSVLRVTASLLGFETSSICWGTKREKETRSKIKGRTR